MGWSPFLVREEGAIPDLPHTSAWNQHAKSARSRSSAITFPKKYCIGAFLLDRNDPTRELGRLREPLITPNEQEREGYVPNVVRSCGSLLHGRRLVIPHAMSDDATTFATLSLDAVLAAME